VAEVVRRDVSVPVAHGTGPTFSIGLAEKSNLVGEFYVHGIVLGEMLSWLDGEAAMEKILCEKFVLV
jgi:hypothetical protein